MWFCREAWRFCNPLLRVCASLVRHVPGSVTGEFSVISGQRSFLRGQVIASGELLQIASGEFRALVARDAELGDILMKAYILRRMLLISEEASNVLVLGSLNCANTLHLREFLSRNGYPYKFIDLDTDERSQSILDYFQVKVDEVPVVICNARTVLRNPSIRELADCLGLNVSIDESQVRDLIVVGAGPSGLAAAIYGASEGLNVLVVEMGSPGGQAGSSSRIENYLGFPMGISGQDLAGRALAQAQKFGANMLIARTAVRLHCDRRPYQIMLDEGTPLPTRSIVLAAGAQYNKLPIAKLSKFEGNGVYYAATAMEAQLCVGEDVVVVGGGNSAGQAAVYLSGKARKVYMLVRSGRLADTMSRYLISRIEGNPAIELHYNTEITGADGNGHLGLHQLAGWRERADRLARPTPSVRNDRRFAAYGLAGGMCGAGQQRLRANRPRSGPGNAGRKGVAAVAPAAACWRPVCPEYLR